MKNFYDTASVILARLMRVLIIFLISLQMAASLTLGNAKALYTLRTGIFFPTILQFFNHFPFYFRLFQYA